MQIIYHYRCDGCEEVHEDSSSIFKCKKCNTEICVDCGLDDGMCFDSCEEKLSPRAVIEKFIKMNGYTYKVETILEEYKNKWGKSYTSYTMSHCCEILKNEIKALLKECRE